jgi:hypothetical protein
VKEDAGASEINGKTEQRRKFIQRVAVCPSLLVDDHVREFAREAWLAVKDAPVTGGGHGRVQPTYDRLKLMIREAGGIRRKCSGCGEEFPLRRSDALYCSAACHKQRYRDQVTGTGRRGRPSPRCLPTKFSGAKAGA